MRALREADVSLTDARRMWVAMRDAGHAGLHSHDVRSLGISGNPSSRAKDIVSKGVAVYTARENRGRRPGSRYWIDPYAPDYAVPVRPNHDVEGDGAHPSPVASGAADGQASGGADESGAGGGGDTSSPAVELLVEARDGEVTFTERPLRRAA